MSTPHIGANIGDISKIVLMPGDPLRAKWMAENYLENPVLINEIRSCFGYTGFYKGKKITIMSSGMGSGSMGIYSWELFCKEKYDVDTIIRVGSCGSYVEDVSVGDVIICNEAYTDNKYAQNLGIEIKDGIIKGDEGELFSSAKQSADLLGLKVKIKKAYTTDCFYDMRNVEQLKKDTGASVVEMEAAALFANAKFHNKKSLCLLTCSDSLLVSGLNMTPYERQTKLKNVIELALEIALKIKEN